MRISVPNHRMISISRNRPSTLMRKIAWDRLLGPGIAPGAVGWLVSEFMQVVLSDTGSKNVSCDGSQSHSILGDPNNTLTAASSLLTFLMS